MGILLQELVKSIRQYHVSSASKDLFYEISVTIVQYVASILAFVTRCKRRPVPIRLFGVCDGIIKDYKQLGRNEHASSSVDK